ncbi:MAG TPA: ROK family protein, partial [Anaerolineales bacterium]|nr:ROK family protein [Anaerolineales bacterium]
PVADEHRTDALPLVYRLMDRLIENTSQPLSGIGIGAPGLVNTNEGLVVNAVNFNWKNLPLTQLLQERYRLPVHILNDCQAAAIGERTYGKGARKDENLVLLNVHHGIGAGIIIRGDIYQGDGGFAGEIGHVIAVREGGELCRCGKRGCLETVASAEALLRNARQHSRQHPESPLAAQPEAVTLDAILSAFQADDPWARELVFKTADHVGMAISALVGVLNIHRIVLQGDMTRFGTPWLDRVREATASLSLARPLQNTHLEIGQLGENAVVLGAAAVFANNYSYLFARPAALAPSA